VESIKKQTTFKQAEKRVKRIRDFYNHLQIFVIMIVILVMFSNTIIEFFGIYISNENLLYWVKTTIWIHVLLCFVGLAIHGILTFRYNIDLGYGLDLFKRLDVSFRLRYQNKRELDLEDGVEDKVAETLRFKTAFEYDIKKWPLDPKLAIEIFNKKREDLSLIADAKLSRYRLTFGTSYSLKKFGKFGIYYRYQENTRVDNDFQTKILGLKYSYSIN